DLEVQLVAQPGVHGDVHAVPVVGPFWTVVGGQGDVVLRTSRGRSRGDRIQRDRISAAAGKPRIDRSVDRPRVVVGRTHEQVIGDCALTTRLAPVEVATVVADVE